MGKLVVLTKGGIKINEYPIRGVMLTIGRLPSNDIQINNESVSGRHARIIVKGNRHILEDLNSRNGTYVNRQAIQQYELQDGDQIHFPNCRLKFVERDENDEHTYNDFSAWWLARKSHAADTMTRSVRSIDSEDDY